MKVLSIKEPYASLIKNNIKKIETRSWKTNYRGKLYIHASKKTFNKKSLNNNILNIIKNLDMNYGNIICECNIIDCVYMDENFIKHIKENKKEYICGEYKIGRYAWILDNIKPINPIPAKGKLNIWEFEKN